jgi:hypothetical protein
MQSALMFLFSYVGNSYAGMCGAVIGNLLRDIYIHGLYLFPWKQ